MSDVIGSRGPNRREYFIGCALQGVVQIHDVQASTEGLADRAIRIGTAVHEKLQAEYEAAASGKKANDA